MAIMILAIAIIPMVSMFDAGLRAAVMGSNYDRTRATANGELEEIRALPFRVNTNPAADSVVEIYPQPARAMGLFDRPKTPRCSEFDAHLISAESPERPERPRVSREARDVWSVGPTLSARVFFVPLRGGHCCTKISHLEDAPARERCQNVSQMTATEIKKARRTRTCNKAKSEPPWNVILHNDWNNSMPRVVIVLKKVIPGMTFKRATAIMWEAHRVGQAVVKSCHKELAELYEGRLQTEGLTVSIEPAR